MFVFAATRPQERAGGRPGPKRRRPPHWKHKQNTIRTPSQIKSSGPLRNTISCFIDIDFLVRYFTSDQNIYI